MKRIQIILLLMSFAVSPAFAAQDIDLTTLNKIMGTTPDSVQRAPMEGFYEVVYGPVVLYASANGRYLLKGEIIDLVSGDNVSEARRAKARLDALDKVGEKQMIIFPARKARHTVTVFTDIDCAYCRKLHSQMKQYNNMGITIRYLSFPRAGVGSASYQKAVNVWCAKNRQVAITRAKLGKSLPKKDCENPVSSHFKLGELMGVRGTPALVTDRGAMLSGYIPPKALFAELERRLGLAQAQ